MNLTSYLSACGPIPGEKVKAAVTSCDQLEELAVLREILVYHRDRIDSIPDVNECYNVLVRYYLLCMQSKSEQSDLVHSRFEAASELRRLLLHWTQLDSPPRDAIAGIVDRVRGLYLLADDETRDVVETGFLEHVFENQQLVELFRDWESDEILGPAFNRAIEWGREHGGH